MIPRGLMPDSVAAEAARNFFEKHPQNYAALRGEVVQRCATRDAGGLERARSSDSRSWGYRAPRLGT